MFMSLAHQLWPVWQGAASSAAAAAEAGALLAFDEALSDEGAEVRHPINPVSASVLCFAQALMQVTQTM